MKVTFSSTHSVFQVKAPKDTMVSLNGTPTEAGDGVYIIDDSGVVVIDEQRMTDSVYLSTSGADYTVSGGQRIAHIANGVDVWAGSSAIGCPFKKKAKGGDETEVVSLTATENKTYTAPTGTAYSPVTVNVPANVGTKTITANGTYTASSDNLDGYSSVDVNTPVYAIVGLFIDEVINGTLVPEEIA
jgi:hypothetical protein